MFSFRVEEGITLDRSDMQSYGKDTQGKEIIAKHYGKNLYL